MPVGLAQVIGDGFVFVAVVATAFGVVSRIVARAFSVSDL